MEIDIIAIDFDNSDVSVTSIVDSYLETLEFDFISKQFLIKVIGYY